MAGKQAWMELGVLQEAAVIAGASLASECQTL